MATVYSLICWGGRTGKSVTVDASTDYVTLTNHGLKNGKGVAFASGTLPSVSGAALVTGTTYYAKWISNNTFELYYDSGLTSKINFTSAGASLVMKSAYLLGLSSLSRWGASGSERIYDGIKSFNTGRSGASSYDAEVAEIGEDFKDVSTDYQLSVNVPAASVTITTLVNGVRSSGFHSGVVGAGYVFEYTSVHGLAAGWYNTVFDGFSVAPRDSGALQYGLQFTRAGSVARNIIFNGVSNTFGTAISFAAPGCRVEYCIVLNYQYGIVLPQYQDPIHVLSTLVTKCAYGVYGQYGATSSISGFYYNNIVVGNTQDWTAMASSVGGASGNASAGTTAWMTTGGTRITIATTDFTDYTNNVFTPLSTSSPQVETGANYYGIATNDIAGNRVPAYMGGGAEVPDSGPYEKDRGYGNPPSSHILTLTNVIVGSRVFIRDQANTTTHFDQIAASSTVTATVTVYGDSRDNWRIKIRKASGSPNYIPYETLMTATAGSSSLYVSQILDE